MTRDDIDMNIKLEQIRYFAIEDRTKKGMSNLQFQDIYASREHLHTNKASTVDNRRRAFWS